MLSKLQKNLLELRRKLQVGDQLIYSDTENYMEFEVIEVSQNIFTTVDKETGEIDERDIYTLQHGWDFKNSYLNEIKLLTKGPNYEF